MSQLDMKLEQNVFYKARKKASEGNERLNSREGAAELLGYACICFRNRSAIGEKAWYFFHTRYSLVSRTGDRGRKISPLSGEVSTRRSNVSRYPRCSLAKTDAL